MIKVGDKIKDNDPRMPNRVLTVDDVCSGYAYCRRNGQTKGALVRISVRRIFCDDKPRRSGFSRVNP